MADNTSNQMPLDIRSEEFEANFGALNLLKGTGDLTSAEGTSYTSVLENPKLIDELMTAPGEEEIMKAVQDPSDVAGAKAKVKAKEDELALESMKANLQQDQDALLKSTIDNFGTENNFMSDFFQNPPIQINIGNAFDSNIIKGSRDIFEAEQTRIGKLLTETVPNFMGMSASSDFLNSTDRDRLQRKSSFGERKAYWKRVKGNDAQYFRMPITKLKNGKTVYEELVSLTPNGEVYRVDPSGSLTAQEIFNDIGDISGTLLTARTGLTLGAALFGTALGPGVIPAVYGGSYFGQIIDKALVSEGVDPSNREGWKKLLDGDAATLAALDTALTFIPPVIGRAVLDKFRGDPVRILPISNVPKEAVTAQVTANTFDLKPLTITQVADNPVWNGIFSQVGAISPRIGNILKGQREKIYTYLDDVVKKSGLNSLSPNNIRYYVNGKINSSMATLKNLVEENMKGISYSTLGKKQTVSGSGGSSFRTLNESKQPYNLNTPTLNSQKFVENLREIKNANFKLNNDIWQKALSSNNSKGVYFDTSSLNTLAKDIKTGVWTQIDETIPGGPITSSILTKEGGKRIINVPDKTITVGKQLVNLKGQLGEILDTITRLTNNQVGNFTVSMAGGGSKTFSGIKQLQTLRQQLNGLLGREGQVPPEVIPTVSGLIKEIDNVILNPKFQSGTTNTSFLNLWKEGNVFHTMNKDVESFSKLSTLFTREASVNPHEYVTKFWSGEWGVPELNLLNKYIGSVQRTGTDEMKRHAFNLKSAMENGFADFVMYNPQLGIKRLENIMSKPDLFKALVPNAKNRKAFENFYDEQTWIRNGSATAILNKSNQRIENGSEFLKESNSTQIWEFINFPQQKTLKGFDKVGVGSEMASDLRASIIQKILSTSQVESKGKNLINTAQLSQQLSNLATFKGEFAKFKPLFVPSSSKLVNGEIKYLPQNKLQTDYSKNLSDIATYVSFVKDTPDVGGAFSAGSVRSGLTSINPFKVFDAGKVLFANDIWARMLSRPVSVKQLERMTDLGNKFTRPNVINALSSALATTFEPYQFIDPNVGTMKDTQEEELQKSGDIKLEGVGPPEEVSSLMPNTMPLQNLSPAPNLASLQVPKSNVKSSKVDYGLLFPNDPIGEAINQRKQGIMGLT